MNTAKIPPNLSYLTIYNPTLRPSTPIVDDEDAQEQAQILFYTSKERAVSRDRMLRQVGLAKALVNFSGMFEADSGCESVHSQTRRMIMVFPEPDFCIHAGVELAKALRTSTPASKSKGKESTVQSLLKGKEKEPPITTYDYSDASVNDHALRDDILRGYERFKLTHGSFTTILSTLGQQALELQLERFFTVWAWSWNIEDGLDFGQHLETPLHPLYRRILPLLDAFSDDIPDTMIPLAVTSTHALPSSRFSDALLPAILTRHLLSLVADPTESLPLTPSTSSVHDGTLRPKRPPDPDHPVNDEETNKTNDTTRSTFMGMGMPNMDVGRWSWLTLGGGKNGNKTTKGQKNEVERNVAENLDTTKEATSQIPNVSVDQNALDDAISSEGAMSEHSPVSRDAESGVERGFITTAELDSSSTIPDDQIESPSPESPPHSPPPVPREFRTTVVHLPENPQSFQTTTRKIYYLNKHPFLIALIDTSNDVENMNSTVALLEILSTKVDDLLDAMVNVLEDELSKSSTETIPSLNKILQPKDRHVFALERAPFVVQDDSETFTSKSIHLFNARGLLRSQHSIQEVISRTQNPQNWHIARGVSQTSEDGGQGDLSGEMYMQVFRKEASLTDVDNAVTGVVRRMEEAVLL
ncbi:hypothetical protein EV361DRAFT_295472 [Lentinula raphanica]|nr:hypothetical protein EV361DRAFT_295472 [Lentinula raphanica]